MLFCISNNYSVSLNKLNDGIHILHHISCTVTHKLACKSYAVGSANSQSSNTVMSTRQQQLAIIKFC